jgi:hypothetical protein
VPAQRGSVTEYLKTIKGTAPVNDLFDEVDVNWSRINETSFTKAINKLIEKFDASHPEKSLPALVDLFKKIEAQPDNYWRNKKMEEVKDLIQNCSGLFMEATTATQYAVQGDSLKINLVVNNRTGANILSADAHLNDDYVIFDQLKKNINALQTYTMFIRPTAKLTQPYWLQNMMEKGSFNVTDQQLIGKGESDPFSVVFSMLIEGKEFKFTKPVRYKFTDPVKGELYQPVNIIPAFSVRANPKLGINADTYDWEVKSFRDKNLFKNKQITANGSISGIDTDTSLSKNQTLKINTGNRIYFNPDSSNGILHRDTLYEPDGKPYRQLHEINYDHIPAVNYTQPAIFTLKNFDLETEGDVVGYIAGAGDKVPEALTAMGYKVVILKEHDINAENLQQFDAIVTGVRAYNTNEWMNNVYDELMQYVKDGGVLLVQYNTSNQIGPVKAKISPYAFNISRNRITDEEAKVNFLLPDHPALNYPNKITEKDFDGWIQERSIYHAEKMDTAYKAILSMKDPGEKEQDGSLIIANYGKGRFVYTGLVFFRELPAGVPGAYRLFANLIANPRAK